MDPLNVPFSSFFLQGFMGSMTQTKKLPPVRFIDFLFITITEVVYVYRKKKRIKQVKSLHIVRCYVPRCKQNVSYILSVAFRCSDIFCLTYLQDLLLEFLSFKVTDCLNVYDVVTFSQGNLFQLIHANLISNSNSYDINTTILKRY